MLLSDNPLSSPRLSRLDLMIKHNFLFSLDLDFVYPFSSLGKNSNVIMVVRKVSILSRSGLDLVSY